MSLLDLGLMPPSPSHDEERGASPPVHADSPPDQAAPAGLGLKRRKAVFADILPRAGNDTYHWLKYGEKLLRDRKTLRHYYRCGSRAETGCNAKKMVDVLVTNGACSWHLRESHNHPAPAVGPTLTSTQGSHVEEASLKGSSSPLNVDTVSSIFPLLSASQGLPPAATSAALAAALLAAQACNRSRGGSPFMSPDRQASPFHHTALPPSSLSGPAAPPAAPATPAMESMTPFVGTPSPTGAGAFANHRLQGTAKYSASPLPQHTPSPLLQRHQQAFASSLAACLSLLSADSHQLSTSQDLTPSAEMEERETPVKQQETMRRGRRHQPSLLSGAPRTSDSSSEHCGHDQSVRQAAAAKRTSLSSRLGKRPAEEHLEAPELKQRVQNGLQVPSLETASGHAEDDEPGHESEDSSSCHAVPKRHSTDSSLRIASLCHDNNCLHSCTWLTLGSSESRCRCYS